MSRASRWLVFGTVLGAAAYFALSQMGEGDLAAVLGHPGAPTLAYNPNGYFKNGRQVAHDVYAYFYPNILYALRSLGDGGRGLLWNPLQNCGQPFFANSQTGLFYPPNVLFLLVGPDAALRLIPLVNFIVAGLSTFFLCRELGVGTTAALSGALAFELGNITVALTVWAFMVSGPWVWLPAAMLFCERLLREPSLRRAVALGVVLAVALLPGYPQVVMFAYQLIALRVLWELAGRRVERPLAALLAIGLGLVLAPLLAAVQLLPAAEVGGESVRNATLSLPEMAPTGFLDWPKLGWQVALRSTGTPFIMLPFLVGSAALLRPATRRHGLFYLAAGLLFFFLAFGPNTPLFTLYLKLPLGGLFRFPDRNVWVAGLCVAVLTALGVDAMVPEQAPASSLRRAAGPVVMAGAIVAAWRWIPAFRPLEWVLAGVALAACVLAAAAPRRRAWAGGIVFVAILLNLVAVPAKLWQCLLPSDRPLFAAESTFVSLRARMTPQERVYFNFESPFATQFALMPKSASLFGVPAVQDYEPQVARAYAEFFVMLRSGRPMATLNDIYYSLGGWMPQGFNQRLLNLTAARYLLVDPSADAPAVLAPPPRLLGADAGTRLYENLQALPRAFYVPRVAVVADRAALLQRLAFGRDDPRQVALIDTAPPSGFTGVSGNTATGMAEFVRNDPEDVVLRVTAPERGFLFLADVHFPGWRARVSGVAAPIMRANYAFRLLEVPAGESTVEFRYLPGSVRLGAWVSGAALVVAGALLVLDARQRSGGEGREREPATRAA